jgi:hypothetical protein
MPQPILYLVSMPPFSEVSFSSLFFAPFFAFNTTFEFDFETACAIETVPIEDAGLGPEEKDSTSFVCAVRALLRVDKGTNADDAYTPNSRET